MAGVCLVLNRERREQVDKQWAAWGASLLKDKHRGHRAVLSCRGSIWQKPIQGIYANEVDNSYFCNECVSLAVNIGLRSCLAGLDCDRAPSPPKRNRYVPYIEDENGQSNSSKHAYEVLSISIGQTHTIGGDGALTVLVSGAAALCLGTTIMVIHSPIPYHVTLWNRSSKISGIQNVLLPPACCRVFQPTWPFRIRCNTGIYIFAFLHLLLLHSPLVWQHRAEIDFLSYQTGIHLLWLEVKPGAV